MTLGAWVFLFWLSFVILTGIVLLVWGWTRDQFKDIEQAKYHVLDNNAPKPWPHQKGK